jgi:hypothetical protein
VSFCGDGDGSLTFVYPVSLFVRQWS